MRPLFLMVLLACFGRAQEPVLEEGAKDLPIQQVELKLRDASWFVDSPASALVVLPEPVEEPGDYGTNGDGVVVISIDVGAAENGKGSVAVVTWLPQREGLVTIPALSFESETTRYQSPPMPVLVSVPQKSSEMELTLTPGKKQVMVGEPLRVDVRWSCQVPTKRLRAMSSYPAFFNDPTVEAVVPRSTVPEEEQIGLPFGGRRVIGHLSEKDQGEGLGVVEFPIYLRMSEAGTYTLPVVRLECARLKKEGGAFAPYAAYFNNGLFEAISEGEAYERVFVESEPTEIEVRPLPQEGRLELFSGLFAPCSFEVSAKPTETEVGQLLEVDILVRSEAPHGFLDLPELTKQRALRSWFKVDSEYGRAWHPEGTVFRTRVRPLTTRVEAFPALEFEIFDPQKGAYQIVTTDAVPLRVLPRDGRDYFDAKTLGGETPSLSAQPTGIWQNAEINKMDEILNKLGNFMADYFWLLLAAGPLLFAAALPWARERRRWAMDPDYRKRQLAYRAFLKEAEGTAEKWTSFRAFLATILGVEPGAWTSGDARRLAKLGLAKEDVELVMRSQESKDAAEFSHGAGAARLPELGPVAKRIVKVAGKVMPLVLVLFFSGVAFGSDWDRASRLFDQAMEEQPASDEAVSLFTQSALSFEAAARSDAPRGQAWLNAGNAWFQSGEIGRAIAAYRQAEVYRPFDQTLQENLTATRALAVDRVEDHQSSPWLQWPMRWVAALLIPVSLGFWAACLGVVRFRSRGWWVTAGVLLAIGLGLGVLGLIVKGQDGRLGVVVVPEVFGRKGPSFRYQLAFNEALHDGLEVEVVARRDGWIQIELSDERQAWIPESQFQLILR
ncbi:hypothetical protein [Haloferula sp.]|uniref:hypothetical protein n=1 Tax=Haloferula sp. TaxID=2497595 RepID=UPI003C74D066